MAEYVYYVYATQNGGKQVGRRRIVRRTPRRLYVDVKPTWGAPPIRHEPVRTFIVDRAALERGGPVWTRHGQLYRDPPELGLQPPSLSEMQAYLREQCAKVRPLPASPPDLTMRFTADEDGALAVPKFSLDATKADLEAEHAYLLTLCGLVRQAEQLAAQAPLEQVSWAEGHLNAVRSAVSGIVVACYTLLTAHERAYRASTGIRSVK